MSDSELTYPILRNELTRRVFQYTFSGPLLLVWSIGLLTFLIMFERPLFALIWSGAMVTLGFMMAADHLRTPKVHERLIRSIIQKRFPALELTDGSFQSAVEQGINAFTETTLKVYQCEKQQDPDAHLRRLIPLTHNMVTLLRESIREAQELERGLNLAKGSTAEGEFLQTGKPGEVPSKRQESMDDIRREVEQAGFSVKEIVQHLETLMLKVFQVKQLPGDPVRNSELVREAEEMVTRLTCQIESRRADRYVSPEVQQTRESLEAGFSEINSSDGLSALQRLVYEYAQLQPLLDRKRASDSIGVVHITASVGETYRLGLSLLHDGLELMRAVRPSERRRLEAELPELEEKIEAARAVQSQGERVKLMQETMDSHLERLDIMQKQRLRVEKLLHLSGHCEASLHRTRMELAALRAADSELNVTEATESLRRTIDQAKEIQEELKKLGFC